MAVLNNSEEIVPLSLDCEVRGTLWALKRSRGPAMVSGVTEV